MLIRKASGNHRLKFLSVRYAHEGSKGMTEFSISTQPHIGLTWERWKRRVAAVEAAGFAGLYLSDHLVMRAPPDLDSLDLIVALTYLASHTQRLHFGPLVAPLSFRHPVL